MSNQTPNKTPEVIEAVVINDTPDSETPKVPSKFKTALRHPIQTIKRHNVVSTALVVGAVSVASTLLLTRKDSDEDGEVTEDTPETTEDNVIDITTI